MIDHTFQGRIQDFQIEGRKRFCARMQRTSGARSVKSLGQALLIKGPESSRGLDALTCYLSLILKHFGPYFEVL